VIRLLALWVLLQQPSYSSSYTFGYTGNAAVDSLVWSMTSGTLGVSVEDGLDISGVIYKYKVTKEAGEEYLVTVQNEDVDGGYIFQDTQDWTDGTGMKIQRLVPLPYTPVSKFGTGSIKTVGTGTIEDASVVYMYRFDKCFDPQNDESCPGYVEPMPVIPEIEVYDALDDDAVIDATEETDSDLYEKEEEEREEKDEDEENESRLEMALAASENALTIANTVSQAALLQTINDATNVNSYYEKKISGKMYPESIALQGGEIVDNRRALRSLAQDNLHNKMIEEQYK